MSYCDEMPYRNCGDMTYASYLARKCGKCNSQRIKERENNIMTTEKIKVTLPNGLTLEGTPSQVASAASAFGFSLGNDGVHYLSSTRGLIRISDMDSTHLRNAMLKAYRKWAESLSGKTSYQIITELRNGPTDKTLVGMIAEFAKRVALDKA